MNNKMIFYGALLLFSSAAIAMQNEQEALTVTVQRNQSKKRVQDGAEYLKAISTTKILYDVGDLAELRQMQQIKNTSNHFCVEHIEKAYYSKICLLSQRGIVEIDKTNSKYKDVFNELYDSYAKEYHGRFYNSYAPVYICLHVPEANTSKNMPILLELQPRQVEEILDLKYLKNWKIAKGLLFAVVVLALVREMYDVRNLMVLIGSLGISGMS